MPKGGDREGRSAGDLGPLPGGLHGLTREQVSESQRERLLAATAELIGEHGYSSVPIVDIVRRASVANRVFYANFESKEAAFIAAFDAIAGHLSARLAEAVAPVEDWPRQVVAALGSTLAFFDEEPVLARFCLVAPFTASKGIAAHCRDRVATAQPYLAIGRTLVDAADDLPSSTEDSLLGGVINQLRSSIAGGDGLAPLLPGLTEFVLAPYLPPEAARELAAEATRS